MEIGALPKKEKAAKLEAIREIADLDAAEAEVNEMMGQLDEKVRRGKVLVKVVVEEVETIKPMVKVVADVVRKVA